MPRDRSPLCTVAMSTLSSVGHCFQQCWRHHELDRKLVCGQRLQDGGQQVIVQARPRSVIHPHDVVHPSVHPRGVGSILERGEVL
jgi:hypothetical protein